MDQPEGGRAPQSGQPPTAGEQPSFPARPSSASPTSNPFSTPAAGDESAQSLTGGALPPPVDRHATGPLTREAAGALLDHGAALLESAEFGEAFATYQRVVGFDDPEVT